MPTRSLPIPLCSDMYWVSTDLSQYYTCCAYLLHSQRFSLHYWFFFFCCGNSSSQKRTTIALTIIFPCWAVPVPVSLTFFLLQGRPLRQISTNPSLTTLGDCSQFSSYFSISIGSSATSTGMLYFFSLKRYKTTLLTSYGTPPPLLHIHFSALLYKNSSKSHHACCFKILSSSLGCTPNWTSAPRLYWNCPSGPLMTFILLNPMLSLQHCYLFLLEMIFSPGFSDHRLLFFLSWLLLLFLCCFSPFLHDLLILECPQAQSMYLFLLSIFTSWMKPTNLKALNTIHRLKTPNFIFLTGFLSWTPKAITFSHQLGISFWTSKRLPPLHMYKEEFLVFFSKPSAFPVSCVGRWHCILPGVQIEIFGFILDFLFHISFPTYQQILLALLSK